MPPPAAPTARVLSTAELGRALYSSCALRNQWPVHFVYHASAPHKDVSLRVDPNSVVALRPHAEKPGTWQCLFYAPPGRLSYAVSVRTGTSSAKSPTSVQPTATSAVVAVGSVEVRAPDPLPPQPASADTTGVGARIVSRNASHAAVEFAYERLPAFRDVFVVLPGIDCVRLAPRGDRLLAYVPHVPHGVHTYAFHLLPHARHAPPQLQLPVTHLGFDPTVSAALLATWPQQLLVAEHRTRRRRPLIAALFTGACAALLVLAARLTICRRSAEEVASRDDPD